MELIEVFEKEYGLFPEDLGLPLSIVKKMDLKQINEYIKSQAFIVSDFELLKLKIDINELSKDNPLRVRTYSNAVIYYYKDNGYHIEVKSDDYKDEIFYNGKRYVEELRLA